MKEDLISFKTAKLAKEKGFDEPTLKWYHRDTKKLNTNVLMFYMNKLTDNYSAPTQDLLQKWLREKHKIYAYIDWHDCSSVLFKDGLPEYVEVFEYMDLEKLLQEALKLI